MIKPHQILIDFLSLLIPSKCITCGMCLLKDEKYVCKGCLSKIPKTNFFRDIENPVSQVFWGRVKLENAFSFYFFSKTGGIQKLIHEVKYHGATELAFQLGREFGLDLKESTNHIHYDMICPVPLHTRKQKRRGYNQSEWLALGMSDVLKIPVEKDILSRSVFTATQTKKNRQQRWENVKDAFDVSAPHKAVNKHILIVDDVLTTGATLEACALKLLEIEGVKVSIASLAYAVD